jgi:hypothetical protein
LLPEVPPFLSGPVAVLLTNAAGFGGRVALTTSTALEKPETVAGDLLGRGNLLLFVPDPQMADKHFRSAGLSFIWDVSANRGYLLSEALQGYAPLEFAVRYTNVVAGRSVTAPQRIEGHRCELAVVTVSSNEGRTAEFQVWQAADLKGLPLRTTSNTKSVTNVLSLSKVHLGPAPADLFNPPGDFTRYSSADVMMSELTVRQHNLKRRPAEDFTPPEAPGPGQTRPPRTRY